MCGFYARAELNREDFNKLYEVGMVDESLLTPRYNIRPKTSNVVVTRSSPNQAELMLWFFHPGWPGFPENRGVINARIESIKENKPFFKKAFLSQRCLIPASHWVEWKELSGVKIPHVFKMKSRKFFAFAGLWNEFTNHEGKNVKGYAIITTEPNYLAATIHNRQPAVLREKDQNTWLDPKETDSVTLLKCLNTYPADDLEVYPVGRDLSVNSPDILKPLTKEQLASQVKDKSKPVKRLKIQATPGQSRLL